MSKKSSSTEVILCDHSPVQAKQKDVEDPDDQQIFNAVQGRRQESLDWKLFQPKEDDEEVFLSDEEFDLINFHRQEPP